MIDARGGNYGLVQGYIALVGIVLAVAGLLAFINPNPLTGTDGLLKANIVHGILHLLTGALALYIAFALNGESQANGVIAFGVVNALIFVLVLLSPNLFGLFDPVPANGADHALHGALCFFSLLLGYLVKASSRPTETVVTR